MRDRVEQLVAWSRSHQGKKLIRFTSVSVISTVVSQGLILILFGITRWMGVIEATLVANCLATIPAYNLNRRWTWGKTGKSHMVKEVLPFWGMSALGIVGSFLFSLGAKGIVDGSYFVHNGTHHHHWIALLIVMAANFIAFGIFWVLKLLVFNRIFHVSELEEVEEHLEMEEGIAAHRGSDVSP